MGRSPDAIVGVAEILSVASEEYVPSPVSSRRPNAVRNVDSCFNQQTRKESLAVGMLTKRHKSNRGTEFFRNR